jgi:dTDP-4-dehydrorhamnose 3,5-epimerase
LIDHYPSCREYLEEPQRLFFGVKIKQLKSHQDERGFFTEIFRDSWALGSPALQWNFVKSKADVLRGFHVHKKHSDYLTIANGKMLLALHDFRRNSKTYQQSCFMLISDKDPHMVSVPVGVGHGFYFEQPSMHIYGVSEYFDSSDEFGCAWDDEKLNLNWPCKNPALSTRDKNAMSYTQLLNHLSEGENF